MGLDSSGEVINRKEERRSSVRSQVEIAQLYASHLEKKYLVYMLSSNFGPKSYWR